MTSRGGRYVARAAAGAVVGVATSGSGVARRAEAVGAAAQGAWPWRRGGSAARWAGLHGSAPGGSGLGRRVGRGVR